MLSKIAIRAVSALLLFLGGSIPLIAQTSDDRTWTSVDESGLAENTSLQRQITPFSYRVFRLDRALMRSILDSAPPEFTDAGRPLRTVLTLPMPDGKFERFEIEHSPVIEPGLAAKYPELGRTYSGRGIDDPSATVRLDLMKQGFHAMVRSGRGTVIVDPYSSGDVDHYLTYFKRDVERSSEWACEFENIEFMEKLLAPTDRRSELIPNAPEVTSGTQLRTYRLALAGNWEYCNVAGGNTVAGCLAAMTTIMNRVNGVYERDLSMRMVMVANNNLIAYAGDNTSCGGPCTSANDPYSNDSAAINENNTNLPTVIGTANFDIGHVFTTGSGGVAGLGNPCGSTKSRGTTGLPSPFGDPFAIDYVAHEMGHQWGANHSYNGTSGNCGGQRSSGSAYEVGSGITIMGYAGICGNQNLALNSIDTFHVRSLEAIVAYSQTGNGNTCAGTTSTGNSPPTVAVVGGPSWNIPKQTPFTLTASASDANGDTLTYDWQEYNLGGGTSAVPNTDADGIARPIFRPYLPTASPSRTFPSLEFILNNANVPPPTTPQGRLTGELLPAITRTMTFQVVVRDSRPAGGGINTATATVAIDGNSGPFAVTAPNTSLSWAGNTGQTVTWNPAGSAAAPVNAANVKISLSTDGGLTFPTTLAASTANDGTEVVTIPNTPTTQARIKIEAVGNIFFDISNANFTITPGLAVTTRAPFDFDGDGKTDLSIYRPSNGQWWWNKSSDGNTLAVQFGQSTDVIAPADFTGDGTTDIAIFRPSNGLWLILRSENYTFYGFPFGTNGDTPVPADYDGDQQADVAVYRPSVSGWFILRSTGGTTIQGFGVNGDRPVPADYDGDQKADIAIFRPSNGSSSAQWWIQRSSDSTVSASSFGGPGVVPVVGRYTGDNKADIAYYEPPTGFWGVLRSEDASFYIVPFGTNGDIPTPGDYDGDGRFDTAIFRPSQSTWYVNRSTAGVYIAAFGLSTDKPVPSAYSAP